MLGLWSANAADFLLILTLATTLVFALPIFLVPLTWARLMAWQIPQQTDLAVYFGRCLGAFILILEALMLRAALTEKINDREVYMKGIDASYHYEGYHVFKTEDLT